MRNASSVDDTKSGCYTHPHSYVLVFQKDSEVFLSGLRLGLRSLVEWKLEIKIKFGCKESCLSSHMSGIHLATMK